jgi:WD40 repeat protein
MLPYWRRTVPGPSELANASGFASQQRGHDPGCNGQEAFVRMFYRSAYHSRVARFGAVAGATLLLTGWGFWPASIHPKFVETFVSVNRHGDDRAATVAFDPVNRVLAIGRESGRLELWNTRREDARLLIEAHSLRVQHIDFGSADSIVFTNSQADGVTRIWNVRDGGRLHELKDVYGPTVPSPEPGLYVVPTSPQLTLYRHETRESFPAQAEIQGSITALTSDAASHLVAVGTASGTLHLLKLEKSGASWKLSPLLESQPYQVGDWIQAVTLLEEGRRLVSVARSGEVAQWDTRTLKRQRVLPTTLGHVGWASVAANEPWLLLAGTLEPEGLRNGKIELVDLRKGVALRFKANTNMPTAVLLPEASVGLILQSGSVRQIRYLDQ